ncbi:unnamed protein product [Sphacelaria rigidula]
MPMLGVRLADSCFTLCGGTHAFATVRTDARSRWSGNVSGGHEYFERGSIPTRAWQGKITEILEKDGRDRGAAPGPVRLVILIQYIFLINSLIRGCSKMDDGTSMN